MDLFTVGNRKACQAACEALSREAATLFGVRFDHTSLDIEEIAETGLPDQAEPEMSAHKQGHTTI